MARRFPDLTLCPGGRLDIGCEACGLVIYSSTGGDVLFSVIEETRRVHHFLDCKPREWRVPTTASTRSQT